MKEYTILDLGKSKNIIADLNEMARQNWRVVCSVGKKEVVILEREMQQPQMPIQQQQPQQPQQYEYPETPMLPELPQQQQTPLPQPLTYS